MTAPHCLSKNGLSPNDPNLAQRVSFRQPKKDLLTFCAARFLSSKRGILCLHRAFYSGGIPSLFGNVLQYFGELPQSLGCSLDGLLKSKR